MKKILSLFLIITVLSCSAMTFSSTAYAAVSGTCGDGVWWRIDNNNVLTIGGQGDMYNNGNCYPWANVKKVIIEDGVKSIGKSVFLKLASLTSAEIGDSVTVIKEGAFRECHKLTSVKLGKGVSEIGDYAFFMCENLTNVELSSGLKRIGVCAFMLSAIEKINIPSGVTTIDTSAFQACKQLKNVEVPDSVTEFGWGVFNFCTALETAKIGKAVKKFDEAAFGNCSSLKSIEFGKSVTYIGTDAFDECTSLKNVYYRDSKSDWERIYIQNGNDCLTNAKIDFNQTLPAEPIKVKLNGKYITFDVDPQLINDRTMVPIRNIFEAMGAKVEWDQNSNTATSKKGTKTVKMTIGNTNMYINGKATSMDVAPVIINGRTLAPVRYVAQAFGATVKWDAATNTVIITSR